MKHLWIKKASVLERALEFTTVRIAEVPKYHAWIRLGFDPRIKDSVFIEDFFNLAV